MVSWKTPDISAVHFRVSSPKSLSTFQNGLKSFYLTYQQPASSKHARIIQTMRRLLVRKQTSHRVVTDAGRGPIITGPFIRQIASIDNRSRVATRRIISIISFIPRPTPAGCVDEDNRELLSSKHIGICCYCYDYCVFVREKIVNS